MAIEGDDHRAAARLAFDLGPTASLASHVLPPPGGWNATAARAAIAVAWNLDLPTVRTHLAPCLAAAGIDVSALDAVDATGVRAARGLVLDYDPDAASGSGALALDVSRATYFERQLDQIPLRRALERPRMFSGTRGVSLAIPFSVTVDYVLDDHRAITAMGDGVLARVLAPAAAPVRPPPIFALDLAPPALSPRAWAAIVQALRTQQLGPPAQDARRIAAQLSRWRTLHVGATLEPATDQLVLELVGERR